MAFINREQMLSEAAMMVTTGSKNVDLFMKVTGEKQGFMKGESQDSVCKDWIEVQSFQYGMMQPIDSSNGLASGRRQHRPLRILKQVCTATPLLFLALINNEHLKEVILSVRKSGGGPKKEEYFKFILTNARIVDFKTGFLSGDEIIPMDQYALVFQKITMNYSPQKTDGKSGAATSASDEIGIR